MNEKNLNNRWVDMDSDGIVHYHYGIEIDEDGSVYDSNGAFYLK